MHYICLTLKLPADNVSYKQVQLQINSIKYQETGTSEGLSLFSKILNHGYKILVICINIITA